MFLVCMPANRHSKRKKRRKKEREKDKKKAGVSFQNNENIEKSAGRVRLRNDEKETQHHTKLQLTFPILLVFFNSPCFALRSGFS